MFFNIYKKAFLEKNNTIWWGGENHDRSWDEPTMFLYFFLVLMSFYFSWKCKKHSRIAPNIMRCNTSLRIRKCFYIIQFILLCVMGLRGSWVGMDTIVYSQTFENATSLSAILNDGTTTEPLYKIFQFILRSLFSSRYIAIFIFSFLIVHFVFSTIKKYYNLISITIAIPAFVCLYYFQSFNLVRIVLAASFMLWSVPLLVVEDYKKYAFRILIATMMHFSSIVLFFPLGLLILYKKNRLYAYSVAICSILFIVVLTNILGEYLSLINRYENYITGNESSGKIGLALFIDYLPCLYICYYINNRKIKGNWANLMTCFTIAAFIIRLLAYFITATGRLSFHFMPLTIILLPYWVNYMQKNDKSKYKILFPFCIIWLFLRFHIYLKGYLASDGIMPYYFFWNE